MNTLESMRLFFVICAYICVFVKAAVLQPSFAFAGAPAAVSAVGTAAQSPVRLKAYHMTAKDGEKAGSPAQDYIMVHWEVTPDWYVYAPAPGQDKPVPSFRHTINGKETEAAASELRWPSYMLKDTEDGRTPVYAGAFWVALAVAKPPVNVHASWLACSNVCTPGTAEFKVESMPENLKDEAAKALETLVAHPQPVKEKPLSTFMILLMAFLAGVILNVMPCVLPVLALKLFKLGTGTHYKEGLAFMAGTTSTFVALAFILISLKVAGHAVGWGFQMQSPAVVSVLIAVFVILGLSMLGVLEIGTSLTRAGDFHKPSKRPLVEAFWQGMLGVVVATPCSAPFMGSALAIALTESLPVTIAVFVCLGVGLAFPFTILACVPALKKFFPKPGMWMVRIKQFLGFTLLATVIWLLSVLHEQVEADVFFHELWAILVVSIGAWLWGTHLAKPKRAVAALIIAAGIAWMPYVHYSSCKEGERCERTLPWVSYDPQLHDGDFAKPTLIYFTAQWCLTCKVQERLVLNDTKLMKFLKDKDVQLIKADWTDHNSAITKTLNRHGRHSVPFILLYKAGQPQPALATEFTTVSQVMETLGDGS